MAYLLQSYNTLTSTSKRWSPKYRRFYNDSYYWKDHEYKPSRNPFRGYSHSRRKRKEDPFLPFMQRARIIRQLEKEQDTVCESGYTKGQGWGGVNKAWTGFILRNIEGDDEGRLLYAKAIHKIEKDTGIQQYDFRDLKLAALEFSRDETNHSLLEEKARELDKEVDELSSNDILSVILQEDEKAYEELNS